MTWEDLIWRLHLRLAGGGRHWHNRRFPLSFEAAVGVREVRFAYRGRGLRARRAEELQDTRSGRCHVLLSGPSVATITDPLRLAGAYLIGVNGSPALLAAHGLGVDLYVVDDPGFVRRRPADFARFARAAGAVLLNYGLVAELLRRGVELDNVVVFDSRTAPFRRPRPAGPDAGGFARRFTDGLAPCGTVAYIALQAAYCLGFRDVRLFGFDLGEGRYYAEARPEPSRLRRDFAERIVAPFRGVGEMVRRREWLVLNCSPASRLPADVLPRADPNAVLGAPGLAVSA